MNRQTFLPLLLLLWVCALRVSAQDSAQGACWASPAQNQTLTLSVTTREVVIDVVATDRHDHPLRDLQESDFRVFELAHGSRDTPQKITAVRFVDPAIPSESGPSASPSGLHVTLGGGCAERTTPHYQISYRVSADRMQSGPHQILVTTDRRDAKLAFSPRYFVGETSPTLNLKPRTEKEEDATLLEAACYHPAVPVTIPLSAYLAQSDDRNVYRYLVVVPTESLPLISLSVNDRHVKLEYAACTFDADGRALKFVRSSADGTLNSSEYVQAVEHGFPSRIDIPDAGKPAFVRFVVRNPQNGNLGAVGVATPTPLAPGELTPAEAKEKEAWYYQSMRGIAADLIDFPPLGPKGSFGSVQPRPNSLCGDVYELPEGTYSLPNFWNLASVGSVHAYLLDVPHQQFWPTGGIPGVTRKTDWFGIDYHGAFWIRAPGKYFFKLTADDGAKLYIDDELVIDADGAHNLIERDGEVTLKPGNHTIHLPYFQGSQRSVALQLFIQPPGGQLQPFDVRDYTPPTRKAGPEDHKANP